MRRQDYLRIAKAIRAAYAKRLDQEDVNVVANALADELTEDNPRFNRDMFLNACGVIAGGGEL